MTVFQIDDSSLLLLIGEGEKKKKKRLMISHASHDFMILTPTIRNFSGMKFPRLPAIATVGETHRIFFLHNFEVPHHCL